MKTTSSSPQKILATCALPYANGELHIGHLLEHVQADIWTRSLRMTGVDAHLLCADDTHGTPIMIRAREEGISPEQLIARAHAEHSKDFQDFEIFHGLYSSTNTDENRKLCQHLYLEMKKNGHIATRPVEQLYCPHDKMFLPDRFVKGTCPKCKTPDQYGDACDNCGATYSTSEVLSPACSLCGTAPVKKSSDHYFFKLNGFKEYLQQWLPHHTGAETANKMAEWFREDLRDWDISRDEPYFGFPFPDVPGKYFYVWVDAPMGYVSTTEIWCRQTGRSFDDYWAKNSKAEIHHFIGKDVTYFHTLFWPAMLQGSGMRSPSRVHVHGFVTVNGEKMSKSKGTFIPIRTYLNHMEPQYLRYYLASKLNERVDDFDLNLEDFTLRVNSDLIGKITNLGSRGAQMLGKKLDGVLSTPDAQGAKLIAQGQKALVAVQEHFRALEFSKAIGVLRELADETNKYFDEKAPWKTLETDPDGTKQVLTTTLNVFRLLAIGLTPVLPSYSEKVAALLGEERRVQPGESSYTWEHAKQVLQNKKVMDYHHLATRIEPDKIKAIIEETKAVAAQALARKAKGKTVATAPSAVAPAATQVPSEIEIDDFMKVDLRVATIIEAEIIPEADKLLRLQVELAPGDKRQIIAGIRAAYAPEKLVGKKVLVVANLKPRKMKFGLSQGMVLAAGEGGSDLFVFSPDSGAQSGQRAK